MAEEQKSQRPHGEKEQEDREEVDEVEDEDEEEEEEEIEDDDDVDDDGDEEEEKRPSKAARLASDESGIVTTAVASPLGLGLGLGLAVGGGEESGGKSAFTFMQMQEFHHQSLIFKHMVAGIPVPIHLILPIWKSVAASYGPHHYPSFVGLGNLCYDFRNSMEPEPGRCRRTDGKKWRCSRDVVPDQKYCERHMHRGRNRSRKPVEAPATTAAATSSAAHHRSVISIEDSEPPHLDNNPATAVNARMGLSPTRLLSGAAACKTGAS